MRVAILRALCVLSLLAACPADAAAQRTAAAASGTVQDSTGGSLPGATVTARHVETGTVRTTVTNAAGRYALPQLAIGTYEFSVELQGFQTLVRRGIELAVGQDADLNFTLSVGDIAESVIVTQQTRVVETAPTAVSSVIDSYQIREMPLNGRDFVQLATLQAGVSAVRNTNTQPDKGSGIRPSFAGARPYQTGYLLDGTDISTKSNFRTPGSAAGVTLGVEAVREFQVVVNSFGAEFGNAAGGVINAVTRSGSNRVSGSAFEFHRNSAFDARNYFDPPDEELPPFKRNQFGFTLGGPMKRDRIFWFAAYEGLREQLSRTMVANVPTAAAREGRLPSGTVVVNPVVRPYLDLWPMPNGRDFGDGTAEFISSPNAPTSEDFFVLRGDWNISGSDSLYARFSYDDASQLSYHSPVPNIGVDQLSGYRFFTVEETHIFSSSTNMLRVAFNRTRSESQDHFFRDIPESLFFVPGVPVLGRFTFGSQFSQTIHNPGSAGDNPAIDSMDILQLHDTFTWVRGTHTWKFGGMVNRYLMRNDSWPSGDAGGQYQFNSFADLLAGRPNNLRLTAPEAILGRAFRQWLFGAYVQDEWKVSNHVTVNAGVRYEAVTVPVEVNGYNSALPDYRTGTAMVVGAPLFDNPSLKNFAPRVSAAWDVSGDGSLAVRGGFGIYHDQLVTNYINQTSDGNPPFTVRADIRNPIFPNALEALNQQARTSTATTINIFDLNDTRQPYMMQFNVSVQRALGADSSVTLAYVGSRGTNLQREVLVNPPQPVEQPDGRLLFPLGARRINPNFGAIFLRRQDGDSMYNSLQARFDRRLTRGLQLEASYTFARAIDDTSISHGATDYGAIQVVQHPFDSRFDRGLANFHVAHSFVANGMWDIPSPRGANDFVSALFSGWRLGGIFQMSSGQPFSVIVGFDVANVQSTNNGTRPNLAPGADSNPIRPGNPDQYFDPSAFVLQERGYLGNLPRNTLIGPGLINLDGVLSRTVRIGRVQMQARIEIFNVLNRANFANPSQTVVFDAAGPVGSAGRITSTTTTARQMQLGLKLLF
jgi:hypothetical protein